MLFLGIKPCYNVSYRPDLNCIEEVFAVVKRAYARQRLVYVAKEEEFDPVTLVRQCFSMLDKNKLDRTINRGFEKWSEITKSH